MPRRMNIAFPTMLRSNLFREQVSRFRRCECRKPNLSEMRRLWRDTLFPTLD